MPTKFTLFPLLPRELRLEIIRLATNDPSLENVEVIEIALLHHDDTQLCHRQYKLPAEQAVYLVNWEFRLEAQRQRTPFLGQLVNFNTDIMHIATDPDIPNEHVLQRIPREILPRVRHIAFGLQAARLCRLPLYPSADTEDLKQYFPNLEHILLVFQFQWAYKILTVNGVYQPITSRHQNFVEIGDDDINMIISGLDDTRTGDWNPHVSLLFRWLSEARRRAMWDTSFERIYTEPRPDSWIDWANARLANHFRSCFGMFGL